LSWPIELGRFLQAPQGEKMSRGAEKLGRHGFAEGSQKVRNDTTGTREGYYLKGRLAMWMRVGAKL
jgi:hypothetical protein